MKNIVRYSPQLSFSKNYLLLLIFLLMPFLQVANASVSYNNSSMEQVYGRGQLDSKKQSKLKKKASKKKARKAKKRRLEGFSFNFWHLVILVAVIGVTLFIIGLALGLQAMWIIGLCLFGLPIFAGIVILLILILGLAFTSGGLE
jgi:hypothetical protein